MDPQRGESRYRRPAARNAPLKRGEFRQRDKKPEAEKEGAAAWANQQIDEPITFLDVDGRKMVNKAMAPVLETEGFDWTAEVGRTGEKECAEESEERRDNTDRTQKKERKQLLPFSFKAKQILLSPDAVSGRLRQSGTITVENVPATATAWDVRKRMCTYGSVDEVRLDPPRTEDNENVDLSEILTPGGAKKTAYVRYYAREAAEFAYTQHKRTTEIKSAIEIHGSGVKFEINTHEATRRTCCIGGSHFLLGNMVSPDKFEWFAKVQGAPPDRAQLDLFTEEDEYTTSGEKCGNVLCFFCLDTGVIRISFVKGRVNRRIEIPFDDLRDSIEIAENRDEGLEKSVVLLFHLKKAPRVYREPLMDYLWAPDAVKDSQSGRKGGGQGQEKESD
uniref:RRM domain-containing protein n=1 Tax=Chromera velia CCMP2878 TaxID=1169474 RepID=A0A0G4HUI5_9ALVE|eukprot:Cvel_31846.t1-p1 / transcript=Cvel_31846.t1 / gene=Cvel_31846 / organism=Chromera_velia_CCMP2878 / gene_product=hypothetical protein / transcript_product=hypothetical protein / location=Cvel_scaffold4821:1413-5279(-) / protein_length=389 / sequence_SO=supercontig / SO=protein_coding / is_pseudo=false